MISGQRTWFCSGASRIMNDDINILTYKKMIWPISQFKTLMQICKYCHILMRKWNYSVTENLHEDEGLYPLLWWRKCKSISFDWKWHLKSVVKALTWLRWALTVAYYDLNFLICKIEGKISSNVEIYVSPFTSSFLRYPAWDSLVDGL